MKRLLGAAALILAVCAGARADNLSFSTFVSASSISSVDPGSGTIAFNYAGNKFVGTEYFNNQLYQTNTNGGGVSLFGSLLPDASGIVGEVVVGASLGQGGFSAGDIYAGSGANGNIYHYANSGGAPSLFATVPAGGGQVRQIFFDPGSSFGGKMIVTTTTGNIYTVNSSGTPTLLASVHEDTEGMDIAPASWGKYAGYLIVGSEGSGSVRLISPTGTVFTVPLTFPGAETISVIPDTLDPSNPLEGFYVANYTTNIQFAAAGQFVTQNLLGDVIVTDEGGGSTAWDLHYNAMTDTFSMTQFAFTGNLISQFEDGIFVTGQRITDTGATPEPSSLTLLGSSLIGLGAYLRKRMARQQA